MNEEPDRAPSGLSDGLSNPDLKPADPPPSNDPRELALLARLLEHPDDGMSRLVYSDFLEDRGELAKANFVRGIESHAELAVLAKSTSIAWRAITCDERVTCTTALCPARWAGFAAIAGDPRRRSCPRCAATLRYCADLNEALTAGADGDVAVIDLLEVEPRGFDLGSTWSRATR